MNLRPIQVYVVVVCALAVYDAVLESGKPFGLFHRMHRLARISFWLAFLF